MNPSMYAYYLIIPIIESFVEAGQDVTTDKIRNVLRDVFKLDVENSFIEQFLISLQANYSNMLVMLTVKYSEEIAEGMYTYLAQFKGASTNFFNTPW